MRLISAAPYVRARVPDGASSGGLPIEPKSGCFPEGVVSAEVADEDEVSDSAAAGEGDSVAVGRPGEIRDAAFVEVGELLRRASVDGLTPDVADPPSNQNQWRSIIAIVRKLFQPCRLGKKTSRYVTMHAGGFCTRSDIGDLNAGSLVGEKGRRN